MNSLTFLKWPHWMKQNYQICNNELVKRPVHVQFTPKIYRFSCRLHKFAVIEKKSVIHGEIQSHACKIKRWLPFLLSYSFLIPLSLLPFFIFHFICFKSESVKKRRKFFGGTAECIVWFLPGAWFHFFLLYFYSSIRLVNIKSNFGGALTIVATGVSIIWYDGSVWFGIGLISNLVRSPVRNKNNDFSAKDCPKQ